MTFSPCVVVPVYDHEDGARALTKRLAPLKLPTIMVNDGSGDSCTVELRRLAQLYDWLHLMEHVRNQGKGGAVLSGMREAHARGFTHALQIDADGQHDVGDIPRFLRLAENHPQAMVAGEPQFDASIPRLRYMARYLTHVWVWIETLSFTIRDSMCGFRVYPIGPVIGLANRCRLGRHMDFDTDIMVRLYWLGMPIVSVPTKVIYPLGGRSNFRLLKDNALITWMHLRLVLGMLRRAPTLICRRLLPHLRKNGCAT